ncbi:TauD-domain-containing protein [Ramaria rubella]|nr:TauD-domain-containing protein [Ramaria rubella]
MAPFIKGFTAPQHVVNDTANPCQESVRDDTKCIADEPLYPFYVPYFDRTEKFPPIQVFDYTDPGTRADKAKPHLLQNAMVRDLNPYIGTVIKGIQISQLCKAGLDELALYAAERKLLIFRDQDFKDIGAERQIEIAKHFGPLECHPLSGNVKGYPEFHVVYRDAGNDILKEYFGGNRVAKTSWHSDVTYEMQPPGTTLFWILEQPKQGGDTLFLSQVEAYNRLSDGFKQRLEGLRAVHSAVQQAEQAANQNGLIRRDPVETEHPVVRQHPVTGEKALFINQSLTKRIVGFKEEESAWLLQFLFDHISKGADFHTRATYKPGTVVVWDNRLTAHSATGDSPSNERRHAVRLTPHAEVPIPA